MSICEIARPFHHSRYKVREVLRGGDVAYCKTALSTISDSVITLSEMPITAVFDKENWRAPK